MNASDSGRTRSDSSLKSGITGRRAPSETLETNVERIGVQNAVGEQDGEPTTERGELRREAEEANEDRLRQGLLGYDSGARRCSSCIAKRHVHQRAQTPRRSCGQEPAAGSVHSEGICRCRGPYGLWTERC